MKPDYIRSSKKSSFSHYTIKNRFPQIVQNITKENPNFFDDVFKEFSLGLFDEKISRICDETTKLFDQSVLPFVGQSIFEAPFFVSEMYFYHRIISILRKNGIQSDPFFSVKKKALEDGNIFLEQLALDLFDGRLSELKKCINSAFVLSLWGNLADLSLFTIDQDTITRNNENHDRILINDSKVFIDKMITNQNVIHFLMDNAGYELISDLYLISILLKYTDCIIRVHVKPMPMFVSDVTQSDWDFTLSYMSQSDTNEVKKWHRFIEDATNSGRLFVETHYFWSSCYLFSDEWFRKIGISVDDLIISKGDLNYRRFFEDREWEPTAKILSSINVSKNSGVLIRTMKSEIVTGLNQRVVEMLDKNEKDWMTSGKFGLIQMF